MHKKPGQISSNTLSLRFMQNAAKTKEEREIEAAKAKVRTEEEWELPPELRESRGEEDQVELQSITYEQSYLPFLFPGFSGNHVVPDPMSASEEGGGEDGESEKILSKGRRSFGKHGTEQIETPPVPTPPPVQNTHNRHLDLPRGARSISLIGRSSASSSKSSNRPPHQPVTVPPLTLPTAPALPRMPAQTQTSRFMKPQVDAPRVRDDTAHGTRKKRPAPADLDKKRTPRADGTLDLARKKKAKRERDF